MLCSRTAERPVAAGGRLPPPRARTATLRSGIVVTVAAVVLFARTVRAESAGDAVRIVYEAPGGCPGEEEFLARVRARVSRMRTATGADGPRLFSVRVREARQAFVGTLDITEPDGAQSHRRIPADTCIEAVDALALVTALAIDPRAAARHAAANSSDAAAPARLQEATPVGVKQAGLERAAFWSFEFSAEGRLASGVSPGPVWAWGALGSAGLVTGTPWTPRIRAGVLWSPKHTFAGEQGAAAFGWTAAVVDLCALDVALGLGASVQPCLSAELGALRAEGVRVQNHQSATRRWVATGVAADVAWRLSGPLELVGVAAVVVPWVPDRFLVGTERIHEVPLVAWRAGLGLAVVWP